MLRGLDTEDVIEKRLINAKNELKYAQSFENIVLNDDFNRALDEISSIILSKDYEYNGNDIQNILKNLLD